MKTMSNSDLKLPVCKPEITAVKVTNAFDRLACLPDIAGLDCVVLEHTIYDMMSMLSDDYDGGFWEYYRLSNGGFYMAPKSVKRYHMACVGNGFEGEVSANTAGIIACAMAYSLLSFRKRGAMFANAYGLLSDFICEQPDSSVIRAALD